MNWIDNLIFCVLLAGGIYWFARNASKIRRNISKIREKEVKEILDSQSSKKNKNRSTRNIDRWNFWYPSHICLYGTLLLPVNCLLRIPCFSCNSGLRYIPYSQVCDKIKTLYEQRVRWLA